MWQPETWGGGGQGDNSRINFYACFGGKQQKYLSHTHAHVWLAESVEKTTKTTTATFLAHFQHINLQ